MNAQFLFYCFLFFILMEGNAAAAGLGVSPSSLKFVIDEGEKASRQLVIYNSGADLAEFSISASSEHITISPESGRIEGGKAAVSTITAAGAKPGASTAEVTISLGSRGREREIALTLGSVIPVSIDVIAKAASANAAVGLLVSASTFVIGLAAYYRLRRIQLPKIARFI